MRKLCINNQ